MLPEEKERQIVARYLPIEDAQERLALIVDRAKRLSPLGEAEHCDTNLVRGCASRVWVAGTLEGGVCRFRTDADSALVKGLAALLCEIYDGAEASEIAAHETTVLESLQLSAQLSPTRLNGLAQVCRTIRNFAANAAGQP